MFQSDLLQVRAAQPAKVSTAKQFRHVDQWSGYFLDSVKKDANCLTCPVVLATPEIALKHLCF